MIKDIVILGSTGSIGEQTLDIVRNFQDKYCVKALTANKSAEKLVAQAREFNPEYVVIGDGEYYNFVKEELSGIKCKVFSGKEEINNIAEIECDVVVAAIVGFAGLEPVYKAISKGRKVAIANKEPLVAAGHILIDLAKKSGANILPVDSEHNAIFQCLEKKHKDFVRRIILTASGGPFLNWDIDDIKNVNPEQAIAHPNWSMGAKISVDSATMMNKALEVIEAYHLFAMPFDKIDVVIHPQSIIHSMVEYLDGSILAQMGAPDMRTPIVYALGWPERVDGISKKLDIFNMNDLQFIKPDYNKFPLLKKAYDCLEAGQAYCIALNSANEIAVEAFLNREIDYSEINSCVEYVLNYIDIGNVSAIDDVIEYDLYSREIAKKYLSARKSK